MEFHLAFFVNLTRPNRINSFLKAFMPSWMQTEKGQVRQEEHT